MIGLLLRNALLLTTLLALPIFFVRAQPYDGHELRAFLTPPEGCPAPCFMGIRPGLTTHDEAIAILGSHVWVKEMQIERVALLYEDPQPAHISWRWADSRPQRLQLDREAAILILGQQVDALVMVSDFRLGDVLLTFGIGDHVSLERLSGRWLRREQFYDGWYNDECIWIHSVGRGSLYHHTVTFILRHNAPEKYAASAGSAGCGH